MAIARPSRSIRWAPVIRPKNTDGRRDALLPIQKAGLRRTLCYLKKIFEEAINKKYKVKKGDKDVFLTRMALGIDQVLNKFAKGDRHAWSMLTEMADKLDVDFLAGQKGKIQKAVQPSHQAILDAYVARQ